MTAAIVTPSTVIAVSTTASSVTAITVTALSVIPSTVTAATVTATTVTVSVVFCTVNQVGGHTLKCMSLPGGWLPAMKAHRACTPGSLKVAHNLLLLPICHMRSFNVSLTVMQMLQCSVLIRLVCLILV